MIKPILTAVLACTTSFAIAQTKTEKLDQFINLLEAKDQAMGSIAIADNNGFSYTRGLGYASVEDEKRANIHTQYRIGSISKMFTAVVFMRLVEEHKINLYDPLSQHYPNIPNADQITMEMLLSHRSGIHNITEDADYLEWNTSHQSRDAMMAKIVAYPSEFTPGTQHTYSNSNYILLTWIIEDLTSQPLSHWIHEFITVPLKMDRTKAGGKVDVNDNQAYSYTWASSWQKETETDMSVPLGAGYVISTASDLTKFLTGLYQYKLLKKETVDQMAQLKDNYGLGMFEIPFYERRAIGHTGGIDAFVSSAFYFRSDSTAVVYLSNGVNYPTNDIMIGALSIYFDKEYKLPEFTDPVYVPSIILNRYAGVYAIEGDEFEISIYIKDGVLMGQGTGQPPFALEAISQTEFKNVAARLKIEFTKDATTFTLKQGGQNIVFTKK